MGRGQSRRCAAMRHRRKVSELGCRLPREKSVEAVKIPSRAELVQRVADIAPVLRANALWGEQNRRLADEVVDAMIGAGVLRMLVPTQYGGYESDMQTVVDVGIQLGRGDGSPAFCATAQHCAHQAVAHFPDQVQDEIFGEILRVLQPGAALVASDGYDNEGTRLHHADDLFVPLDPESLPGRLTEIGYTDIAVALAEYDVRFIARKPMPG